ncbi:hypothetical protein DEI82_02690 [Curtobacterium sp. MCBD17_019]|nr:hypothetical protein DEI82_02690 [Curtobacterium sp. MCBD17_019]
MRSTPATSRSNSGSSGPPHDCSASVSGESPTGTPRSCTPGRSRVSSGSRRTTSRRGSRPRCPSRQGPTHWRSWSPPPSTAATRRCSRACARRRRSTAAGASKPCAATAAPRPAPPPSGSCCTRRRRSPPRPRSSSPGSTRSTPPSRTRTSTSGSDGCSPPRTPSTIPPSSRRTRMTDPLVDAAHRDLVDLTANGIRFHGSPGIEAASVWLEDRLTAAGLAVTRQTVTLPGWEPGESNTLRVTAPIERVLPVWPMLWSGSSDGPVTGTLRPLGPQGIWGDSITWQRFVVTDDSGTVVAYVHARDVGPAAPQPLPHGSDLSVPHLVVGRIDGLQLREWCIDGGTVTVELTGSAGPTDEAAAARSDNLVVDIPGTGTGHVLVCAHYDSFFNTVGAYDNGSGTIALLHLAEGWARAAPTPSVRLVWFTAEEWHLGGSRHHVDTATPEELAAIDFVVNIDGLGRGSYLETFASPEGFGVVAHDAITAHAAATGRTLQTENRFPPTTGTDDASFYRAGVPSLFLTFNDLHRLHQPEDLPNEGIATNIVWTTALVRELVTLPAPARVGAPGIL